MLSIDGDADASCTSVFTDGNKILTELAQRDYIGLRKGTIGYLRGEYLEVSRGWTPREGDAGVDPWASVDQVLG